MKKVIAIVLVCSIFMAFILYGTNYTYDFKTHLQAIAEVGEVLPAFDAIVDIWDDDAYYPHGYDLDYVFPYYGYNAPELLPSGTPIPNAMLQIDPDGDWGIFEIIKDFFNGFLLLIMQIMYTASWAVFYLVGLLQVVAKVSPTAGIVERVV